MQIGKVACLRVKKIKDSENKLSCEVNHMDITLKYKGAIIGFP